MSETMEVNVVDEKKNIGKNTIDSGAAENVLSRNYLPENSSAQRGACFIAANGTRMENLGEKRVYFEATDGVKSNSLFQVVAPNLSNIENVHSGRRIDMQLVNGRYAIDVEFLTSRPCVRPQWPGTFW